MVFLLAQELSQCEHNLIRHKTIPNVQMYFLGQHLSLGQMLPMYRTSKGETN